MSDAELDGWLDAVAKLRGVKRSKGADAATTIKSLRRRRPPVKRAPKG